MKIETRKKKKSIFIDINNPQKSRFELSSSSENFNLKFEIVKNRDFQSILFIKQ